MAISQKNIWVAAGDGDLERVKELVEQQAISPNSPDPNTYTPMHAAASYGHIHILDYLISHGGDVNITDSDGDTPLYTVENLETAQYLVEKGAIIDRVNEEGISPILHLLEEFPQVSAFLQSHSSLPPPAIPSDALSAPSQYAQNAASEQLTASLLSSIQDLIDQGVDPETVDAELRRRVEEAVLNGLLDGIALGDQAGVVDSVQRETAHTTPSGAHTRDAPDDDSGAESKRPRTED
ncbi:hypothetical protein GYMLUDRAFT_41442 [Collybiopsis luxurians FD-317 M1]|uniref:Ankyrin n=1 Tax=Collybiopsis luxurians FD-317 M1 TaxID=944289 RepID=A0A0D0CUD4_9AGAR|nr:hypothetical protein GYMLUDRAFT_41442 [Collybiopsis luxurians FD-317 M1]